jgi:hypothetical protein
MDRRVDIEGQGRSNAGRNAWAREPGGRLLLPDEARNATRNDLVIALFILVAVLVALCLDW